METLLGIELGTWMYLVAGAVFSGYAILDGFDLGAGSLHLFFRKEKSRRIALNAIGPVWDGNEVWLIIGGGVLFAGFPKVYATLLSSFYIPFILFLVLLIFRAVAIEFRSKEPMTWWRNLWDRVYFGASTLLGFVLGVVLGNAIQGIPFDGNLRYQGDFWQPFNPYALLTGLTVVSMFAMHGSVYLAMKTEDKLYEKLERLSFWASRVFTFFYIVLSVATLLYLPEVGERFREHPILFLLPLGTVSLLLGARRLIERKQFWWAFICSSGMMAFLLMTAALGLFPDLLRSSLDASYSLTAHNSAASPKSLRIILLFVAMGAPLVLLYTVFVFRTFRGKVQLDETSY